MGEVMKSSKKKKIRSSDHVWNLQLQMPNVVHLHVEFVKIIYVHKCWIEYHAKLIKFIFMAMG
jgi:hypothetical protein